MLVTTGAADVWSKDAGAEDFWSTVKGESCEAFPSKEVCFDVGAEDESSTSSSCKKCAVAD